MSRIPPSMRFTLCTKCVWGNDYGKCFLPHEPEVECSDYADRWYEDDFVTCKCGEELEAFGRVRTCPSCGRRLMA